MLRCLGCWFVCLLSAAPLLAAPAGVVLQLPCDRNLADASGHGNDAWCAKASFVAGQTGQGLKLGGEAATISDRAELRLAPGLRLDLWVRFDGEPVAGREVVVKDSEYMLRVDPAGEGAQFAFFVYLDGWEPRVRSRVVPRVGTWYHLVAGWDGHELSLEVNGEASRGAREGQRTAADAPLRYGPMDAGPVTIGPFDGVVDEFSLTNPGARSGGVAHWAFDGDLRDEAGGHALAPATAGFQPGRDGQAVNLATPLTTPDRDDLRLAPGLRIDCAVRFDQLPTGIGCLVSKDREYQLRVDPPNEGGRFSFFINLGGWEPRVQSAVKAEPGVWYRLSASWNGQAITLDVNGQRKTTVRSGLPQPGPEPVRLGGVPAWCDDLRIENPRLPLLRLTALEQERTLLRAGVVERLSGTVENLGSPARRAVATLSVGPGVTCLDEPTVTVGPLASGERRAVAWTVRAETSLSSWAAVQLADGPAKPAPYRRALAFFGQSDAPTPPVFVCEAVGTTWYVDSIAGDNARAGTSPETAWRDFAKVTDKVLGPGDRLLLRRGSVFNHELRLEAHGTARRWAEIGAYGDGARPILRRDWHIDDRCAFIRDPDFLRISGLTFCYAGKGLIVMNRDPNHSGVIIEDCLAHHIEGLYRPNAHGIPEWQDRLGAPGDGLNLSPGIAVCGADPRDVLLRDCEMFQCSWAWFAVGDNLTIDRVFTHDNHVHNTSPHPALISARRSWLINSLFHAPGWHASAGTMGIMLCDPEGLVIRNCTFRQQPDSGSADEGGIDFENTGHGCLVDRCTFERNAGAAIEMLGLEAPQTRNVEIAGSRFIQNNLGRKLGPAEVYVWGQTNSADVCCSTGIVRDCGYVLNPGVQFFINEAPKTTRWEVRANAGYDSPAALRRAMPLNDPPAADAGPDIWTNQGKVALAGRATDSATPGGKPLAVHWEVIEGPGAVTFTPADAAATTADLSVPGDYLLRLVADDGELWHSDLVVVHRLANAATAALAWDFSTAGDKEGWTEAGLGTKLREYADQRWSTRAEPIQYVGGGFYIVALDASTDGHLLSKDSLALDTARAVTLRLRLMNHTPATRMRLRYITDADRTWDERKSVPFDVVAGDTAPRAYTIDLSRAPGWAGRIRQIRLDLATGAPLTGTVRLDYVALGD
ncbi:MAG: hypothetical protein HZB16_19250 [Armatimonadetes bacterium]|nr:hypothetical protein [Armatimonadota bacterium]